MRDTIPDTDWEVFPRLLKRARIAWPQLGSVTDAELEAFVRARVMWLDDDVRIEDLLLVCACAKGVRSAEDAIQELFSEEIERAHKRIKPPVTLVQARHLVMSRLLAIPEGGAARIALYRGDADFGSWMRNAINRTLLEAASTGRVSQNDTLEDAILKREVASPILALDPELQRVKRNFMAGLRLALMHTINSLEPRERALLRNAIVDGLDDASLVLMYGLTAEELRMALVSAKDKLEHRVRNALAERMRISDRDHASLARLVATQLDASLAKALGG
jgi:RNA polymerase sigma-70 factor